MALITIAKAEEALELADRIQDVRKVRKVLAANGSATVTIYGLNYTVADPESINFDDAPGLREALDAYFAKLEDELVRDVAASGIEPPAKEAA